MDPGTLAAIVALAVAFLALMISLAQVILQYIVTGQLIRICDSVVYGKMPGQGRRVWDFPQFRFRVVYSIPQISLDSSMWPGASHQRSLPAVNSTLPDLRLARKSPANRSRQEAKRFFDFPGQGTRSAISGEASWVSFVRTIQHSSGESLKYELIEGDADRCPVDLPVVPMQLSMRDVIAGAIRAGMECTDVSFQQQTLSMQGAAGTITSSRHPVLGALLHFAPKRPDEEHGLRTKKGMVDPHWMMRMWDVTIIAGCEYNIRARKHFEEDEGPWIRTSSDRSLVKHQAHVLHQLPGERNTLRQRRPLGTSLTAHQPRAWETNETSFPNVIPSGTDPDRRHDLGEIILHRPQDGEWSFAPKYPMSTTEPLVQDGMYSPSTDPAPTQSSSRLGWFHGLLSNMRKYLPDIVRLSDTAVSHRILPTAKYGNRSSHDNHVELESGLSNVRERERIITNHTTASFNRIYTTSEEHATVTPQSHYMDAPKDRSNQSQALNAPSRVPRPYLISGGRLNENDISPQSSVKDLYSDQEQQLARARTEQVLKKWQYVIKAQREEREKRSKVEQDTRQRGLSEAPSEGFNIEQKANKSQDIGRRSRSARSNSSRSKSRGSQQNRTRPQSGERGRRPLRDDSMNVHPQLGRLQTRSQRSRRSSTLSSVGSTQHLGPQVISSPSPSGFRPRKFNASVEGTDPSRDGTKENSTQELSELEVIYQRERDIESSPSSLYRSPSPIYRSPSPISRSPSPISRSPSLISRSPSPLYRSRSPVYRSRSPSPRSFSPTYISEYELSPDRSREQHNRRRPRRSSSGSVYKNQKEDTRGLVEYGEIPVFSNGGYPMHWNSRSKPTSAETSDLTFDRDKQGFWSTSPPSVKTAELVNPARQISLNRLREENRPAQEGIPHNAQWTRISSRLVSPEALEQYNEPFRWERFEEASGFIIVLRVLNREEIEAYADLTKVLRGIKTAPQNVSFELPSESDDSDESSASHHSFERVRPEAGDKNYTHYPEQTSLDSKYGNDGSENDGSRPITGQNHFSLSSGEDELSDTQQRIEEMSSDKDTSGNEEPRQQPKVSVREYGVKTTSKLQNRRHSVSLEQTVSDDEHLLFLTSDDVLKRTDQRIQQCIDIEIALSVFQESYRNEINTASDAIAVRERVQALNIMLTELLTSVRQNLHPKDMANFAVYELDILIRSVEKSLVVLESEFALFEIDTATRKRRRSMWAKMILNFKKRNACSLLEHMHMNCSFASELLTNLKADRPSSTASEQLKEQISKMNRWPFYAHLVNRERSSSRHTSQSSRPSSRRRNFSSLPNHHTINTVAMRDRESESSDLDTQRDVDSDSDATKNSRTRPLQFPGNRIYQAEGYSSEETSLDTDTSLKNSKKPLPSEKRKRNFLTGDVNWLWICQVDIIPGYFATPWKHLFSEPICTGAISVLLRGLDFFTDDSTRRSADRLPRYDDWIRAGNRTYPSYAINAKGGIVVSGIYEMVKFDTFGNYISPIELLKGDGHQARRSYAQDLQTLLNKTAELMSLDCWLSFCGRLPEICDGPSNLLRTMPALVQRIMADFELEFAIVDRTSSDGGFQIIQDIADNLKQELVEHGLSEPEQLFAFVALLRAAKTALCVIHGTDTAKLRDVLIHDVQVYLA